MKTTIICEIGQNWDDLDDIQESIDFALSVGAYPKLQAWFIEETVSKKRHPKMYEAMKSNQLKASWYQKIHHPKLFYSVFGPKIVSFLEESVSPWAYKVASADCVNKPLMDAVIETKKPSYVSIGGTTREELAMSKFWLESNAKVTLMHCMVEYPAKVANLGHLTEDISVDWRFSWGYSDHTANPFVPSFAVSRGASAVECHFKIRDDMKTPDSKHSLNKEQFKAMVKMVRLAEEHGGMVERPTLLEKEVLSIARRGKDGKRPQD